MRQPLIVGLLALLSCRRDTSPANTGAPPKPPEYRPSAEQLARKARSEERLRREGVNINASLPVIEGNADAHFRPKDEVVDRAIALFIVAVKGEGLEQNGVDQLRTSYQADGFFSPKEQAFIRDVAPTHQDRVQFAWRYEGLGVMHWALGYVPRLETPSKIVDAGSMVKLIANGGAAKYRDGAALRSAAEVLDEADLIYRYDWACVDARIHRRPPPTAIDCEVVVERHYALNWLIGYENQAWDEVTTDT